MWPRRSQAPAAPPAPSAPAPRADDDCGWLVRAVAKKKKLKKKANDSGDGDSSTQKKRPRSGFEAKPQKLPRGIGWSQSTKLPKRPTSGSHDTASSTPTGPPTESFDDVFAEIYGTTKRAREATIEDEGASLPLNASVFLPDSAQPDRSIQPQAMAKTAPTSLSLRTSSHKPKSSGGDKWEFEAPHTIELDAFDSSRVHEDVKDKANSSFDQWKDEKHSHTVSDNFVRLNMRKRFKGSSGKAKKQPAYLRSRGFVDIEEKDQQSSHTTDTSVTVAGGLLDDGIDFIEECLEMLKRHEAGVDGSQQLPENEFSNPNLQEIEPPRCQHALVCQRMLVKKKSKNHGKAFFSCPLGFDEGRCDYFLWEDNHTQFALQRLLASPATIESAEGQFSTSEDPTSNYVPLDLSTPLEMQTTAMLSNLRIVFGHPDFRPGQRWAIERVFQRKRTLLVLPTGAGKSLCYQYPALFLPGITIVISPLVSLINDQFHNLPAVLKKQAMCVSTSSSSKTQYAEFVRDLLGGKLRLLFVSPEKALTSGFQRLLMKMQSRISLVCVDEAHCISEWSHHFRPSYLRLEKIFGLADSVLAITATASRRVERDILKQLKSAPVEDKEDQHEAVLRMPWQRENLHLHVVRVRSDEDRLQKLCELLTTSNVNGAIIMYVHQQWQAEAMANLLQERLAIEGDSKGRGTKWTKHKIAAYHAKMDPDVKEKVRLGFLSGRVKLVIATIAFGMGIDKQNVRLVIHYHVPSSIEHYLQQVGRAGRDGRDASALLFLLTDDVLAFRSLLFSNALHASQLQKLVELITNSNADDFPREFERQSLVVLPQSGEQVPRSYRVWLDIASLEQHLDMKAAMVETFLTLLSIDHTIQEELRVRLHPTGMSWCVMSLMENQLKSPQTDPMLKRLVGILANNDRLSARGYVEIEVEGYLRHLRVYFHVGALARELFPVGHPNNDQVVDSQSRRLMQNVRAWQASGLIRKFQMERPAFDLELEWATRLDDDARERLRRSHCVTNWTQRLFRRHEELGELELKRLRYLYSALNASATDVMTVGALQLDSNSDILQDSVVNQCSLEERLSKYFDETHFDHNDEGDEELAQWRALTTPLTPDLVYAIEQDVEALTSRPPAAVINDSDRDADDPIHQPSSDWHGYNVARIFHGLASPCFPSKQWRDQIWWRKYSHVAFEKIVVIADKVIKSRFEDKSNSR